jgi:hypothetical protein
MALTLSQWLSTEIAASLRARRGGIAVVSPEVSLNNIIVPDCLNPSASYSVLLAEYWLSPDGAIMSAESSQCLHHAAHTVNAFECGSLRNFSKSDVPKLRSATSSIGAGRLLAHDSTKSHPTRKKLPQ